VKDKVVNGAKIVCWRVFEEATSKRPEEDPGQYLGVLNLCEDGTYSYEVYWDKPGVVNDVSDFQILEDAKNIVDIIVVKNNLSIF
jgi:hypothetical protein